MIEAILQQVTRIPLPLKRWAQHNRLGEHPSRQRGSGLDFDQIKEYQQGDTVRKINWAATARKGSLTPMVNTYYEEKDSTVMLLVDLSASMDFGSQRLSKKALAAEICASLVYSALTVHDRVGFMGFAADVLCYLPPRHAWSYQRRIPEAILSAAAMPSPVQFANAVNHLGKWLKQPSLLFLLSDFLVDDVAEVEAALSRLRRRHDLVSLLITDRLEMSIPFGRARLLTRDLETGKAVALSFTRKNQRAIEDRMRSRQTQLGELFQGLRIPHLAITSTTDYAEELTQLLATGHRKANA